MTPFRIETRRFRTSLTSPVHFIQIGRFADGFRFKSRTLGDDWSAERFPDGAYASAAACETIRTVTSAARAAKRAATLAAWSSVEA